MLAFTSVYFLESGLFNGLQSISLKFFLDLVRVYDLELSSPHPRHHPASALSSTIAKLSFVFSFLQANSLNLVFPTLRFIAAPLRRRSLQ
jgi:hypothetical protein